FAAVEAPVLLARAGAGVAQVRSRYHSIDTAHLVLHWRGEVAGHEIASGQADLVHDSGATVGPGQVAQVRLFSPEALDGAARPGERVVTVAAVLAEVAPWAPAGHVVSRGQWAEPAAAAGGPRRGSRAGAVRVPLAQAPVGFAGAELTSLAGQAVSGPAVELWRAAPGNGAGAARAGG